MEGFFFGYSVTASKITTTTITTTIYPPLYVSRGVHLDKSTEGKLHIWENGLNPPSAMIPPDPTHLFLLDTYTINFSFPFVPATLDS